MVIITTNVVVKFTTSKAKAKSKFWVSEVKTNAKTNADTTAVDPKSAFILVTLVEASQITKARA